jgi:cation diffusion facilitator CzcD-associated flavoprotein CzcO
MGIEESVGRRPASGGAPRVVIVGAGFSGIALGVKLKRADITSFDV